MTDQFKCGVKLAISYPTKKQHATDFFWTPLDEETWEKIAFKAPTHQNVY